MKNNSQKGVVSLFVVIFTALLVMVVTVGFVQLMVQGQQQATSSDLSKDAYDAAEAGVQDAERLILVNQNCIANNLGSNSDCAAAAAALADPSSCGDVAAGLFGTGTLADPQEIQVQQNNSANDKLLQEAYTCVKVQQDTPTYKDSLQSNGSDIVPLQGTSSFNQVEVSWFLSSDAGTSVGGTAIPTGTYLPVASSWPATYPAMMRTQLVQTGDNFSLSDLDSNAGTSTDNSTLFLYPLTTGGTPVQCTVGGLTTNCYSFGNDFRRSSANTPVPAQVRCNLATGGYACSAVLNVPAAVGASTGNGGHPNALLRLTALYNKSSFQVQLLNNGTVVPFNGVQPSVDSTGRANDLFRRVQASINLTSPFTYPSAEVNTTGNLCKDFFVTNNSAQYKDPNCSGA